MADVPVPVPAAAADPAPGVAPPVPAAAAHPAPGVAPPVPAAAAAPAPVVAVPIPGAAAAPAPVVAAPAPPVDPNALSNISELRTWIEKSQTVASGLGFAKKFFDPTGKNYAPMINSASYLASKSEAYGWTMRMLYRIMSVSCLIVPSIIIMVFPQDTSVSTVITYYVQALGIPISSINDFSDNKMNLVILGASAIAILVSLINTDLSFPYVIPGILQVFLTGTYFFADNVERDLNDLDELQLWRFAIPASISLVSTGIMLAALWNVWISNKITIGFPVTFSVITCAVIVVVPFYIKYSKIMGDQRVNLVLFGMTSTLVVDTVYLTLVNTGTGPTANTTSVIAALTDTGTSTTAFSLVLALLVALYSSKNELTRNWSERRRADKVLYLLGAFNFAMLDHPSLFATIEEDDWIKLSKGAASKNDPCALTFIDGENVARWLGALIISEANCILPMVNGEEAITNRYKAFRAVMMAVRQAVMITQIDPVAGAAVNGRFKFKLSTGLEQTPLDGLANYFGLEKEAQPLIQSLHQRLVVNGPALRFPVDEKVRPILAVIKFLVNVLRADDDLDVNLEAFDDETRKAFKRDFVAAYGPLRDENGGQV